MLFQFALRPVEQITPWGTAGKRSLHWYGLTDGWSWMDVGTAELFRYTPEIHTRWGLPADGPFCCYPDYQVVRLWEDLWDVLQGALEPIPDDLLAERPLVEEVGRRLWVIREVPTELTALFEDAVDWWGYPRLLSTLHLTQGPNIRLWRSADTMHVAWDNRDRQDSGVPIWTADHGFTSYKLDRFVGEVRDFHDRLADAMRPRVERIRNDGPPVGVQIDMDILLETQAGWDAGMGDPLTRQTTTDWDQVRAALDQIRPLVK